MKRIGIFGCTADPWTIAHQAIVEQVLEIGIVDEVCIIPTVVTYHRTGKSQWLSISERLEVIEAFCNQSNYGDRIFVWKNELDHAGDADRRFFNTLQELKADRIAECAELHLILGTDSLANFNTWYRWNDIADAVKIIAVLGRDGADEYKNIGLAYRTINISKDLAGISATKIRAAYAGRKVSDYIADVLKHKPTNYEYYKTYDAAMQHYMSDWQLEQKRKAGIIPEFGKWLFMQNEEPLTLLCHTPIFDLVQKPAVMPGFKPVAIKSPDWATVIAHKDGMLLMVNQLRYGTMKRYDEFPCGMVEPNESAQDAAERELKEETGIAVTAGIGEHDVFQYLGSFAANPAFMTNHMHYFYVDLDKHNYTATLQHLDEHEQIDVLWKSKDDVVDDMMRSNCSSLMAGAIMLLMRNKLI